MRPAAFTLLMYHELSRAGRELCDSSPGYTRYVVDESTFEAHLASLQAVGTSGESVSGALESSGLALTFDDGCETDLLIAAPLLERFGFGATFYLVSGWIGRRGFLSEKQVAELAGAGFEIGSHGVRHAFLSELSDQKLRAELRDSKTHLEQLSGREIAHLSCPGGRFDARVATMARELGYASVATSRAGRNAANGDRFRLNRMAITCNTTPGDFERACRGEQSPRDRMRGVVFGAAKAVLGNGAYQKMRGAALEKGAN